MTGPGGTGKMFVVNTVKDLMTYYGCGHLIRFLAPTGGAAALIDGMTVHKGLGIKIQSTNKGKGSRPPGESKEAYEVNISVKERIRLREEWKNVEYLLIDEVSLLGQELLAEIDEGLRFAKEKHDTLFGGMHVIFSGDFYQYPPVRATPLYSPILPYGGQTDAEICKRLGRISWKSVNVVVSLTEQHRMKGDTAYGDAVQRLRTRECTIEDLDLFNSRVIASAAYPNGVDLFNENGHEAAVIVSTNKLREALNAEKAVNVMGGNY